MKFSKISPVWGLMASALLPGCSTYMDYADTRIAAFEADARRTAAATQTPPMAEPVPAPVPEAVSEATSRPIAVQAQQPAAPVIVASAPVAAPEPDLSPAPTLAPGPTPRAVAQPAITVAAPTVVAPAIVPASRPQPIIVQTAIAPTAPAAPLVNKVADLPTAITPTVTATAPVPPVVSAATAPLSEASLSDASRPSGPVCQQTIPQTEFAVTDLLGQIDATQALLASKAETDTNLAGQDKTAITLADFTLAAIKSRLEASVPDGMRTLKTACDQVILCTEKYCSAATNEVSQKRASQWQDHLTSLINDHLSALRETQRLARTPGFSGDEARKIGTRMSKSMGAFEAKAAPAAE